jgi:hypothetical protein
MNQKKNSLENDFEILNEAIKTKNETTLIEIFFRNNYNYLQNIKNYYNNNNINNDLIYSIKEILSPELKQISLLLFNSLIENICIELNSCFNSIGNDIENLIEIIITIPNYLINNVCECYYKKFNEKLIENFNEENFIEKIFIEIFNSKRNEKIYPNNNELNNIIIDLYENFNENKIINIFCNKSYIEILMICYLFEKKYNKKIEEFVNEKIENNNNYFELFVLNLIDYITNPSNYFAKKIHKMKNRNIFRILIMRYEINMNDIKEEYKKLYKIELEDEIQNKFNGNLGKALIYLINR